MLVDYVCAVAAVIQTACLWKYVHSFELVEPDYQGAAECNDRLDGARIGASQDTGHGPPHPSQTRIPAVPAGGSDEVGAGTSESFVRRLGGVGHHPATPHGDHPPNLEWIHEVTKTTFDRD